MSESRWRQTWSVAGRPAPPGVFEDLATRYAEPHRAYHTLDHILDTLARAAAARPRLEDPFAVELALWFHDAVYDTRASDNEEQSAALAARLLAGVVPPDTLARVCELIRATKHPSRPTARDAQLVADIDLAILGAPPEAFAAYDRAIRAEYAWVPEPAYRAGRRKVLQSFLDLESIYLTAEFRAELEAPARGNLCEAVTRLSSVPRPS